MSIRTVGSNSTVESQTCDYVLTDGCVFQDLRVFSKEEGAEAEELDTLRGKRCRGTNQHITDGVTVPDVTDFNNNSN